MTNLAGSLEKQIRQAFLFQDALGAGAQKAVAVEAVAALHARAGAILPDELTMHALARLALDLVPLAVSGDEVAVRFVTVDHNEEVMLVSRRSFLGLIAIIPAAAKQWARHIDTLDDPIDLGECESAPMRPSMFSSGERTIAGPVSIFDVCVSGAGGEFGLVCGDPLRAVFALRWVQHRLTNFRWVAAPGSEILVPKGSTLFLHYAPDADSKEIDLCPWFFGRKLSGQ